VYILFDYYVYLGACRGLLACLFWILGVGEVPAGLFELCLRCNTITPLLRAIDALEARTCDSTLASLAWIDIRLNRDHILRC
jgi:membrane protein required for beta-lactamase induction